MTARAAGAATASLDLPPGYRVVCVAEPRDAFAEACRIAGHAGAGSLVWQRDADVVDFAVVLEPEEALATARRALFAGMVALADALSATCPPEKQISFDWPDTIRFDGARLGGGRLGWPADCADSEVPAALVFSAMLIAAKSDDPGLTPGSTSLAEEACGFGDGRALIEAFARYLLRTFDLWAERGFAAVAEGYLARLAPPRRGARLGLAENGDLLIGSADRVPLLPALGAPAWLDRDTGKPRL